MVKRKIIHNTANFITSARILCSLALLFCTPLSLPFFVFYAVAGLSDIFDGWIARKTNTATKFGAKLDTIADLVFTVFCLIKLMPILNIPIWLYIWIAVITFIKAANIAAGYIRQKEFISVHSVINKLTGGLLFVFPLTLTWIDLRYSAAVICAVATTAAVYEGYLIQTGRTA